MSSHEEFLERVIRFSTVTEGVREAFSQIDRALFVPESSDADPYTDTTVDLSAGSTISQPSLVAVMIEGMQIKSEDVVFELGTASGYSAAVMSVLAKEVVTVEINDQLAETARANIANSGRDNVEVITGDGLLGMPGGRRFDKGVLTAALKSAPSKLLEQLEPGGRIIAPVVTDIDKFPEAVLTVYDKNEEGEMTLEPISSCVFVPIFSNEAGGFTPDDEPFLRKARANSQRKNWARQAIPERWAKYGIDRHEIMNRVRLEAAKELGLEEPISEEEALGLIAIALGAVGPSAEEAELIKKIRRQSKD